MGKLNAEDIQKRINKFEGYYKRFKAVDKRIIILSHLDRLNKRLYGGDYDIPNKLRGDK